MTVITLKNHPEALTLSAIELAERRLERAVNMIERVGQVKVDATPARDKVRRRMAAAAIKEARGLLASAEALLAVES